VSSRAGLVSTTGPAQCPEHHLHPSPGQLFIVDRARHTDHISQQPVAEKGAQPQGRQSARSRQALSRLAQIAKAIPILAVPAMIAAIGAMVWQRRPRLARLQLEGFARFDLWRTILLDSVLLLGAGCLCGAVFGLYGQQLADRALADAIDFPVVYSITAFTAFSNLVLMMAAALLVIAVPGYLAASAPVTLALQD
jgi:predicted lysophospholipase L1 biosynthesis ABC-type transport system permease subunit